MKNLVAGLWFWIFQRHICFTGTDTTPCVIIISFIEWQGAFQRPQHLARELAAGGLKVLYLSLLRIHRALSAPNWLIYTQGKELQSNLTVITPLAFPLDLSFSLFCKLNNLILLAFINRYRHQISNPYVIVNAPFFNSVVFKMNYRRLLYDIMDELTSMPLPELKQAEVNLIKRADVVTSGTAALAELKSSLRENIKFISCGVDYEHFSKSTDKQQPLPAELARIPHPIVGYFGAVNERIDWELITEVAKNLPEVNFVFIGPIAVSLTGLKKHSNLHFMGWRPYEILPRYLAGFDIAIVPYRLTAGVELVNPVKVLEYLAGEKPVISTDIADVRRFYGEAVFITKDASEFIALIRQIIANPGESQEKIKLGKKLAQEKSWQMMAAEFRSLLKIPS